MVNGPIGLLYCLVDIDAVISSDGRINSPGVNLQLISTFAAGELISRNSCENFPVSKNFGRASEKSLASKLYLDAHRL